MKRSWWLQAFLYGLLVAAAAIVLLPSVLPSDRLPAFLLTHARRMRPSVDIQGGLRLVYEVDVDGVVSATLRRLASEVERSMSEDHAAVGVSALPTKNGTLIVRFERASDYDRLSASLASEFGLDEADRRDSERLVVLRLGATEVDELVKQNVRAALQKMRGRVDGCLDPEDVVTREGNRLVIELPGIDTTADASRIKSVIERL
jgi:preprotein translocase subunit SecD